MQLCEANEARFNHQTGNMEINFDPATITVTDFRLMIAEIRDMRKHILDYIINGRTFEEYVRAQEHILELMQPRIKLHQKTQADKRDAWQTAHPELRKLVDLVSPHWLYRLRGNELRNDVSELTADIDRMGVLWPVIIIVGKLDRRAYIGEGNHRIEAALRLKLDLIPARVIVQREAHGQYSYDVSDDLLIPSEGYVPSDMKPSKVFRSLAAKMNLEGYRLVSAASV
jgi:hypothetical protein